MTFSASPKWIGGRYFILLFDPEKFSARGIDRDPQLGVILSSAVDDVPDQLILFSIPIQNKEYRLLGILLGKLAAAVLFRHLVCLIAIDFQKIEIEDPRRGVRWTPGIFSGKGYALFGSVGAD